MWTPYHPAPGNLGELVPGFFVVPQNPIKAAQQGVGYVPHFGELMPAKFVVPQNPLIASVSGSTVAAGMGCRVTCKAGMCGCDDGTGTGMGTITDTINQWASQLTSAATGAVSGLDWKVWALAGGVVALMFLMGGGRRRRTELSQARAEYRAKVAQIKGRSPRRYQRY